MINRQAAGGIIEQTLKEIISNKGNAEEEEKIFAIALNLIGLAMAGHNSPNSTDDKQKARQIIEG